MFRPHRLYFCSKRFDRLNEQDLRRLGKSYTPKQQDLEADHTAVVFSMSPFNPSEQEDSEASGVVVRKTDHLWEVEVPSTFKSAYHLIEGAQEKAKDRSLRTWVRNRLRRYLKMPSMDLTIQTSALDNIVWLMKQESPCWAEPGPKAEQIRVKLMAALHELRHANPTLATNVAEYFQKDGEYSAEFVEAAFRGEKTYTHDKWCDPEFHAGVQTNS